MELLFMDESGDNGFASGSTEHFILAGISIGASDWKEYFWKIVAVKEKYLGGTGSKLPNSKAQIYSRIEEHFLTRVYKLQRAQRFTTALLIFFATLRSISS